MLSYELSKQLKDAGFPQPKPQCGQAWGNDSMITYPRIDNFQTVSIHMVFLPTFEDIWKELPTKLGHVDAKIDNPYFLTLREDNLFYINNDNFVFCVDIPPNPYIWVEQDIVNGDITQAAALLWLKLKEHNLL